MKYHLSLDGGGSKLNALVFDEEFHFVARGRGGGINGNQVTPEMARKSVQDAISSIPAHVTELETVRAVFVGSDAILEEVLRSRFHFDKIEFLEESRAALLAGSGRRSGLLAISGTGSDVFNIQPDSYFFLGGWGPFLGDQGSGAWVGLQAVRSVVRDVEGWGTPTILTDLILDRFHLTRSDAYGLVPEFSVHQSPFVKAASLVPLVAKAAGLDDKVSLNILERAGIAIGVQMNTLLRETIAPDNDFVTVCGGVWKTHPIMREAFQRELQREHPCLTVQYPWFEHVMCGVMIQALDAGMTAEEAHERLSLSFASEIWHT